MSTVQLPGSQKVYTEITIHTSTHTANMDSAQEFQSACLMHYAKQGILDDVKHEQYPSKQKWKTDSIMCKKCRF